ncbi:hypothetical protein B5X24_HaOG210143 [Helicoverpa armigera]|uniref:C-type lectin domain-containing protein n=1 Tax=Helicoverpa armigera TaxID=29058 RepID=A0A2W1BH74_HELAM|nr:hypothetical protein B5X24_HaOG210143 [Helicoverpa armigera]
MASSVIYPYSVVPLMYDDTPFILKVHLQFEDSTLRDYVLHSIVDNFIRGNFTPTSYSERPCRDETLPYFLPKHMRTERSKHVKKSKKYGVPYRTFEDYSIKSVDSLSDGYYFRPKYRSYRDERSVYRRFAKSLRMRRRYLPARVVSGPLASRPAVLLQWSLNDAVHLDSEGTSVVFRLRYRKTTSATIYQVFFTKKLRLDCALRLRSVRVGRVHSGHVPRAHGCRVLVPAPTARRALLVELHKLNVPCAAGFIRFAPNTPTLCGKLDQIPPPNRKFLYTSANKNPVIELHGRPTFAAIYRLVDHCHNVLLTGRNGSFEVGPTVKLSCSYEIHLPYGNRVALRLQMGTGPMKAKENDVSNIIHEDVQALCRGMELSLEDGDSKWKHCSQPGDPLRSVQIVSEGNAVRLNISITAKKNASAMWLKVWWMDKAVEDIVGHCEYGWVLSGDFCISAVREAKKAWRQAEAECVRLGGHLASVLNERQQQIMDQLLIHAPGAGVDDVYWIGATDAVHEGEFRWSDGLPFSYAHWFPGWRKHSGQPNDDGTSGQDCVEARREFPPRPPAADTFMWNDRGCREHNYFVCEKPGVEDPYIASKILCNETIVLSHTHPHAIVSSPGFPRPYPDDVQCVSEIRAPPAHTLRLHFEELLTEHEPQ